jgi:arylsulfatase A-like enzyme
LTFNHRSSFFTSSILLVAVIALLVPCTLNAQPSSADFDNSGLVDFNDFLLFVAAFGSSDAAFDLDGSALVDFNDFLIFSAAFGQTSDASRPNILLIIADDIGLDATPGYDYGDTKPTMPVLDDLAAQGITYDNVWSAPLCSPTRATILTGRYGFRTGVLAVDKAVSETETSIQSYLKQDAPDYADAIVGKWHLSGAKADDDDPNTLGVSHYAGFLTGALQDYYNWPLTINGSTTDSDGYATTVFTDLAIDWVGQQSQPWFLWLAYTAPHTPFHLPPDSLHDRTNLTGADDDIEARPRPYYFASLEALDTEMGRLLENVDLEDTIVIFIGDNGTPGKASQSPVERTRAKGSIYEGGIHVPMIVAGNGVTRQGVRDSALINTVDLFATIADLAGTGTTEIHDSVSFSPTFTAGSTGSRTYVYSEIETDEGIEWAIRNEHYKLIGIDTTSRELYQLTTDAFESQELIGAGLDADAANALSELESLWTQLKAE